METHLGQSIFRGTFALLASNPETALAVCIHYSKESNNELYDISGHFDKTGFISGIIALGAFSTIIQQITALKINKKAKLRLRSFGFQCLILFVSYGYWKEHGLQEKNELFSEFCQNVQQIPLHIADRVDRSFYLLAHFGHIGSF